jgi:hypothetical protein
LRSNCASPRFPSHFTFCPTARILRKAPLRHDFLSLVETLTISARSHQNRCSGFSIPCIGTITSLKSPAFQAYIDYQTGPTGEDKRLPNVEETDVVKSTLRVGESSREDFRARVTRLKHAAVTLGSGTCSLRNAALLCCSSIRAGLRSSFACRLRCPYYGHKAQDQQGGRSCWSFMAGQV